MGAKLHLSGTNALVDPPKAVSRVALHTRGHRRRKCKFALVVAITMIAAIFVSNASAATILDDFNRSDGSLGANWTIVDVIGASNPMVVSGNQAKLPDSAAGTAQTWNDETFGANYELSVTIGVIDPDAWIYLLSQVPSANPGSYTGYLVRLAETDADTMTAVVFRGNSGSYTTVGTTGGFAFETGDVITFKKQGANVYIQRDGVTQDSFTDDDPLTSSGYVGMGGDHSDTATVDDFSIDVTPSQSITTPTSGATIGGATVPVSITISNHIDPTGAICYLNGGYNIGTLSSVVGNTISGTVDVSTYANGSRTIMCSVYSDGGTPHDTATVSVTIDNSGETPPVASQVFVCSSGTGTEEDPCVMSVELGPNSATFLVDLMYALGFLAGLAITTYCLWWLRGLWPGEKDAGARADRMV